MQDQNSPSVPASQSNVETAAPAKEAKAKLSPWCVEQAINISDLENRLLEFDAQGYFIYKVIYRQDGGGFVIIAKPKNYVNQASGIRKHLESISKSFSEMLKLDQAAIAASKQE